MNERLLRQYIRESIQHRELLNEEVLKVRDLKAAIEYTKGKKLKDAAAAVAKEAGKKGLQLGFNALLSMIPGASFVKDAVETGIELKDLYTAAKDVSPTAKKKNPMWDKLTIDPDASAIVDDAVEQEFINLLGDRIKYLDDDAELPDADTQLSNFLKVKYNKTHITKAS
jgi:hypothetical protein